MNESRWSICFDSVRIRILFYDISSLSIQYPSIKINREICVLLALVLKPPYLWIVTNCKLTLGTEGNKFDAVVCIEGDQALLREVMHTIS